MYSGIWSVDYNLLTRWNSRPHVRYVVLLFSLQEIILEIQAKAATSELRDQ